jgi:hypothetical protein
MEARNELGDGQRNSERIISHRRCGGALSSPLHPPEKVSIAIKCDDIVEYLTLWENVSDLHENYDLQAVRNGN